MANPKRIVILGTTGSIGRNTLDVVARHPERFQVVGVSTGSNVEGVAAVAAEHNCRWASIADERRGDELARQVPQGCEALCGEASVAEYVCTSDVDIVVCAASGGGGLNAVLAAIKAGKTIALASKEILVMAGNVVMNEAEKAGARILPVDSEHCGVFQCLQGRSRHEAVRVILTASGGPFRAYSADQLARVTPQDALKHPTWKMGRKITVDSATLVNKGLELIEAHWLFGLPEEKLEVAVHPQSIVHAMVEYREGSMMAQMALPDMRLPIQYALTYPETATSSVERLDITRVGTLTFEPVDDQRFPAVQLTRHALRTGGTMPVVLNAANDVAVESFCRNEIGFIDIYAAIEEVMNRHESVFAPALETVFAVDGWAREAANEACRKRTVNGK